MTHTKAQQLPADFWVLYREVSELLEECRKLGIKRKEFDLLSPWEKPMRPPAPDWDRK